MARVTAAEATEKMIRRVQTSTGDITRGVQRVTEAPGVAAARQVQKMMDNWMQAITSGRWAQAVEGVSLQEWRTAMIEKGIPRISQGMQAAEPRIREFFTVFLPEVDRIKAEVDAMPNNDIEDSIRRSAHFQREMNKLKGTFRRGR